MSAKGPAGEIAKLQRAFERRLVDHPALEPAHMRGVFAAFTENSAFRSERQKQWALTELDNFETALRWFYR
jgi:hypothetical protein